MRTGTVYIVGGGPGDPGLLTVRAARLLRRADVVVHDALISREIMDSVPVSAERIDVGKRCGGRHTAQARIEKILVEAAGRARVVVRLKGGDPLIYGRGGEEALALRRAGIPFEIVPGISAALGVAAYAGIPLTHRDISSAVTFVTGQECAAAPEERVDWERLARSGETLVVYMGTRRLAEIAERLIRRGRSPLTPAVVVESATTPRQRTIQAPLEEIADRVEEAALRGPALAIIGEVVSLRAQIAWFERRPLHGSRVLIPRSRAQPSRLARALAARGAEVIESPRMIVRPPPRPGALRDAVRAITRYEWVMFTSPTAVDRFWEEAVAAGLDARAFAASRLVAFGTATTAALLRRGLRADVAAPTFVPSRVLVALGPESDIAGRAILFPRDGAGRSPLASVLSAAGARVDEVDAYRVAPDPNGAAAVRRQLDAGEIAVVAFSSSTTVRRFVELHGPHPGRAAVAVIGEETAATARSLRLPIHLISRDSTIRGLIREIRAHATVTAPRAAEPGAPARGARLAAQR